MRILHLGKYYWPFRGGIENVTRQLAEGAVERGHDVVVLAHVSDGAPREATIEGARIRRSRVWLHRLYTPLAPGFLPDLWRLLRRQRPAVIHVHLPNPSAFFLFLCPPAWRLPWVLHWHADVAFDGGEGLARWLYRLVYRPLEWWLLKRCDAVIVTSPNYRDNSLPLRKFRDKCVVIPLACEVSVDAERRETGWPPGDLKVLMVGRATAYKGHAVLFRALGNLEQRGVVISAVLVGAGDGPGELAGAAGLSAGQIRFAGRVEDSELADLYSECDLLCLPSLNRAEAFGLVLLEAMAHGKAVVTSDLVDSGVSWVVEEGVTGWKFPPGNSDALAERLAWCAQHPGEVKAAGARARRRLSERFSTNAVLDQVLELYEKVVDGRR